jgi:hypothetical protein
MVIHHFPFRDPTVTRARLRRLFRLEESRESRARDRDVAASHMKARLESLEAVYAGEWPRVRSLFLEEFTQGVSLVDWRTLQPAIAVDIPRWYPVDIPSD